MDILKNPIELSATVVESFIILEFLGKVLGYKHDGVKKQLLFYSSLIVAVTYITFVSTLKSFGGLLDLVAIGIFILHGVFCLRDKLLKKILFPIIIFVIILIINVSITYFSSFILGGYYIEFMSPESPIRLLGLFITKFLFFIITRILLYITKKDEFDLRKSELFVICTLFLLSSLIAVSSFEIQIGRSQTLFNMISMICLIVINILIFAMFRRVSRENKNKLKISLLELQLSEQKEMLKDVGHLSKEIKRAEHDIKHHFISILGSLQGGKCEEAIAYVQNLLGEYETSIFKYISIDNNAVNSVLNFKIGRCHAHNIDIKIEIESGFEAFDTTDICVLISNLLDNAIEASLLVVQPKIALIIKEEGNYLCILVMNKIMRSVLEVNSRLETTKSDKENHGFGLYSVSQIIEKYDGLKNFIEKGDYFIADICLKKELRNLSERIKSESN